MVLSQEQFSQIEKELEEITSSFGGLDKGSQTVQNMKMLFEFDSPIEWYYGFIIGKLVGHAEASAIKMKGRILDDEEISQVNDMVKSFGPDIKETISKLKLA